MGNLETQIPLLEENEDIFAGYLMNTELMGQARKRVMKMLEKKIEERRRGEAYHEDFLQHLLKDNGGACCDEVPPLTDAEIQDNILTMIIAGHS